MIIKGHILNKGKKLGDYLLNEGAFKKNKIKNEKTEVWEANGLEQGDTVQNILEDFKYSAIGTHCEKPIFNIKMRADKGEMLTKEQWLEIINRLEDRLDLNGHERVIVVHTMDGQEHMHVAWNRIDAETHKAAPLHYYKNKCTDLAREIEREYGLRQLSDRRRENKLSNDEKLQAQRYGQNPEEIKAAIRECWRQADTGNAFSAALDDKGMVLARGDRRDFVIVGAEGAVYSVARATGSKTAAVREKLGDLNRDQMPTVEEARAIQKARELGVSSEEQNNTARVFSPREDEERERQKRSATLAALLYDKASMPEMQRDALRYIKDVHRQQEAIQRKQAPERKEQEKQELGSSAHSPSSSAGRENGTEELRSEVNRNMRKLRSDHEIKREDKKNRTEQTEYQRARAERAALREQFGLGKDRGRERRDDENERERERER